MVVSGEETGHLDEVFIFLAEYMDRTYAMNSKARNALIYPAFVVVTFVGVMILMLIFIDYFCSLTQQFEYFTNTT